MFSSAFKSFSSNITSNYDVSKQPSATVGVWTVFEAKKKGAGAQASVFIFDRKSLDVANNGFGARATSATSVRKVQDEVVERLKKEASSLARLRHPSILQLVEPVEETRSGGLMFATEPVLCSLSGALSQKDRSNSRSERTISRSASNEGTSSLTTQEVEIDELEIQKGLLQVAKGLEFLHDSAKLVHGNLTPDAIMINAKSDWKISGLGFAGPPDGAEGHQPIPQISLSEVLYFDSRIPRSVQLDLDYASPDFVLDTNINFLADIFSLGLVILACYRQPHKSPVETHGNQSTYKKIFSNASTVPTSGNNYLCQDALPRELNVTLPRMLTRRPAGRMTATEFQQSQYFDNILVNTMRFLDAFPAKSTVEKTQFMKGLGRVLPQFPPSVLGKKILSVLLDEMKDRELLPLITQNIFQVVKVVPSSKELMSDKILPRMREIFLSKSKSDERDTSKDSALLAVLGNIQLVADNCSAKQFKDDLLPIVHVAMESSTHALTDAALQALPIVLPLLDFSTVKHELFPVVAAVFSKTSSLSIKIRGLEALGVLCGASVGRHDNNDDDFAGRTGQQNEKRNVSTLDKFTMQEKVVPLLKAIKTKEPAVMMAALKVLRQIGVAADTDFLATEVMPILWTFSLGPLLDLPQFKAFMDVIKSLAAKIEREQTRKLQEMSSGKSPDPTGLASGSNTSNGAATVHNGQDPGLENDFERLVLGNKNAEKNDIFAGALTEGQRLTPNPPSFSWAPAKSSGTMPSPGQAASPFPSLQPQPISRSVTPDVSMQAFPSLQPLPPSSAPIWGAPPPQAGPTQQVLQPTNFLSSPSSSIVSPPSSSTASWQLPPPPGPPRAAPGLMPGTAMPPASNRQMSAWPPSSKSNLGMISPPGPATGGFGGSLTALQPQQAQQQKKTGLDKYESLL
jgi:SCY1-like protein 2